MVEKNSIVKLHSVCLTVVDKDPECILFCNGIGGTRVEGGGLGLGYFSDLSVKLGGGSLVKFDFLLESTSADSIEHAEYADSVAVCSVFRHVEGYLDVGHGSKVVNFGRSYI